MAVPKCVPADATYPPFLRQLSGAKTTFVEVDPHALTSSALGRSQQVVAKLFDQTLPELVMDGPALVLLDDIETLAVSRHRLNLEANQDS